MDPLSRSQDCSQIHLEVWSHIFCLLVYDLLDDLPELPSSAGDLPNSDHSLFVEDVPYFFPRLRLSHGLSRLPAEVESVSDGFDEGVTAT